MAGVETWTPRPADADGTFVYIDIGGVDQDSKRIVGPRQIPIAEAPSRARQLVKAGDILVSTVRPNLNAVAVVPEGLDGAIASTGFCVLRPVRDRINGRYLFHWLRTPQFISEMVGRATGASYPAVNDRIVRTAKLPLPAFDDQLRIASALDEAERLRQHRQAVLTELDDLKRGIFFEMFGDPATNSKGWSVVPLGELLRTATVFNDGDWVESKDQDPEGDVRLIQLADVGIGAYLDRSRKYLSRQTAERLRCTFLRAGDVLIARMPDPLGRACIFPGDVRDAVTVVDVCVVRTGDDVDAHWFAACLNTPGFRSLLSRYTTGTTRARISRGNLAKIGVIAPPISTQRAFANKCRAVDRVAGVALRSSTAIDELFASIQLRAFRGEL